MNFEEFQSTRIAIDDVRRAGRHALEDEDGRIPDAGLEYATGLYIVKVGDHWPKPAREMGPYYLVDGNRERIGELAELELALYEAYECELTDEPFAVAGATSGLV
jgi:hypothetical protein